MTTIRRVVSAARPTVNTFFEALSTELTNTVDTILGKSSEGVGQISAGDPLGAGCTTPPSKLIFTATVN
jgi:hypothetical protein